MDNFQVTFRNGLASDFLKRSIEKKLRKLKRLGKSLVHCHVVLDRPHRHHHKGNLYSMRIELGIPGKEIVISRRAPIPELITPIFDTASRRVCAEFEKFSRWKYHRTE